VHFSNAQTALEMGCHVLVEKPSTLLLEDTYLLGEIAEANGKLLGTVVQNRLNLSVQFAKNIIDQGWLGKLQNIAVRLIWNRPLSYYQDEWHGRWLTDGGVISQQGYHHIDVARFLCGEIGSVFSLGANLRHKIEVEDTSIGLLEFKNGALGTFEFTTACPNQDLEASIKIVGSDGLIEIGGVGLNQILNFYTEHLKKSESLSLASRNSEYFTNGYGVSHFRVLDIFAKSISEGQSTYFTWKDTTNTLAVIHALYASQERGAKVSLGDKVESTRLGRRC
jgi:predicted dehydrogenase